MHQATIAVAPDKPTVATQFDMFSGSVDIPLNPVKTQPKAPPSPPTLQRPEQTVRVAKAAVDSDDEDDGPSVDLESVENGDTIETQLAKRMFLRMMWDLGGETKQTAPDLFGQKSGLSDDCSRLDALIWLYSLNPDGSRITFEWVCDALSFDPHRIRRIAGRSMREELKRVVQLLATIISPSHAQACEEKLSDYVDVSSWRLN